MFGTCSWYWSSSPVEDLGGYAWYVDFDDGYVYGGGVDGGKPVRCVR